jgi:hypothetical protein
MKNKNLKNLLIGAVVVIAGVTITMYSCEKQDITPNSELTGENLELKSILPQPQNICSDIVKHKIVIGKNERVGEAYIYNDAKNVNIILFAEKGTYFKNAYLDIESDWNSFPMDSKGEPAMSDFAYSIEGKDLSNVRRFSIPIEKMGGTKYFSAVVQVRNEKYDAIHSRAWVHGGRTFGESKEGLIFIYNPVDCSVPEGDGKDTPIDVPSDQPATGKPGVEPVGNTTGKPGVEPIKNN